MVLLFLIAILLAVYFYLSYSNKSTPSKVETFDNIIDIDIDTELTDIINQDNVGNTADQPSFQLDLDALNDEIALEDGMDIYDYLDNTNLPLLTDETANGYVSSPLSSTDLMQPSQSQLSSAYGFNSAPISVPMMEQPSLSIAPSATGVDNTNALPRCYNLLVLKKDQYYLYNTSVPENDDGTNPMIFNNINEYKNFQNIIKQKGFQCPDLEAQRDSNVLEVKGLPPMVINPRMEDIDVSALSMPSKTFQDMKYNKEQQVAKTPLSNVQYAAFEPHNQFIGTSTTEFSNQRPPHYTENAMDSNWGGYLFTQQALQTDDYSKNRRMVPIDLISMSPTLTQPQ